MTLEFHTIRLNKRYPLRISRGLSTGSTNLFVYVSDGPVVGIGESAPGTGNPEDEFAGIAQASLESVRSLVEGRRSIFEIDAAMRSQGIDPAAAAGLEMALWDHLAKRCGVPLRQLLGLPKPCAVTSVTIGINQPEVVRERVPELLARTGARALKVKLGAPEGLECDQSMFEVVREVAKPFGVKLRADANGGWTPEIAIEMMRWLAERDCDYVEQPLPQGTEDEYALIFPTRPLPVFVDESCRRSQDVPALAQYVDGVNVKLMKTGGIMEALRTFAAARAHGLQTMIGCMGESSIAISAGASISALCDHVDLDSHLNLSPDPAFGASMIEGVMQPADRPGHGGVLTDA